MKKNLAVLCALSLALAGCSSDEPKEVTPEEKGEGYGYIAVNIVQSGSAGSRAETTGFEYGNKAENKADYGLFYIFSEDGNTMYGAPQYIKLSGEAPETSEPAAVKPIYDAVLVFDKNNKPAAGAQIVCVLNAPADLVNDATGFTPPTVKTLSTLQAQIGAYGACTEGAFIMSNSVYKESTNTSDGTPKFIVGASIAAESIADSKEKLKDKRPVDIYVERVVAKVRYHAATEAEGGFKNTEGATLDVDGAQKTLTIKVTGIEVANIAQSSYLIKKLEDYTFDPVWAWTDPDNHRSYWETVPEVGTGDNQLQFGNKTYNNIAAGGFDITKVSNVYVQPNTSDQKTAILVTAQLMDGDKSADIAYIYGAYTTKEKAMELVVKYLSHNNYRKKVDGTTELLEPADLVWKNKITDTDDKTPALKSYEVVAQLDPEKTFSICDSEGNSVAVGINDFLMSAAAKAYRAQIFTDGMCYYFVNIDQTPVTGQTEMHKHDGVVRNHIYDLTLSSIEGIGTPIFNPDDEIIPEKVDNGETFYLAAKINVLAWKLVNQTVDFK